jgi:hypothetical protein
VLKGCKWRDLKRTEKRHPNRACNNQRWAYVLPTLRGAYPKPLQRSMANNEYYRNGQTRH